MPEVPVVSNSSGLVGLSRRVAEAFAENGSLAKAIPAFESRPSQQRMAENTARVLENGSILLAEAGTGTGKTLAYLVPAILSGQRILISTGTKNLQDQIFYKDLPALSQALEVDINATYMKGRSNYLCLHRFYAIQQEEIPRSEIDQTHLDQLAEWSEQTETGDRAEVEDLPDSFSLWNDISATSENCVGTSCPQYEECYVTSMRRRASEADLVIVNHHLLCADASVRQSDYGEVIPACSYVVVDEAHQLEDVATQYFGMSISSHRFDELDRDGRRLLTTKGGDAELEQSVADEVTILLSNIHSASKSLFGCLATAIPTNERRRMNSDDFLTFSDSGHHLIAQLGDLINLAKDRVSSSEDFIALARRADELQTQLVFILKATDPSYVYFVEHRRRSIFLHAQPIDVSRLVNSLLLEHVHGVILTSATLTVDNSFHYIKGRLGIKEATELRLSSEFDYTEQTILYVPRSMPAPNNRSFTEAVATEVRRLLSVTSGRAFVLFTSYVNLHDVESRLRPSFPYPLLVQGSAPRNVLLREFRSTPNAVLLATSSFWQGVDVAGEALSCVIIDKLPFASPYDPLTAARMEKIETDGGNPFADYQIPLAILNLLQGIGRLLRHRTDRGVLALLDSRLYSKGYGQRFLESLPPAPVTDDLKKVDEFFNGVD